MKCKVCASIITYNIDEKIIKVVDSIIEQVEYVVIIDNNSKKETINILNKLQKKEKVKLIFNSSNNGIAKSLNQGVEFAKSKKMDWILTLDHDSICEPNMIENMLSVYNQRYFKQDIAILAPKVFEINKQKFISKSTDEHSLSSEIKDCIQSGSMFNLDIFDYIGYFNEDLFIYHVDYEFCERVLENNYKIIQCNNTILEHEEGYKIEKKLLGFKSFYNNYSSTAIYYITRNTIYMSKKYSILYIKRIVKDFIFIFLYDKNRFGKLKYWIKGLKDGLFDKYGKLN